MGFTGLLRSFSTPQFQRVLRWFIGMIGFLPLALFTGTVQGTPSEKIIGITLILAVIGPSWWIGSQKLLAQLLSNEGKLRKLPPLQLRATLSLDEIAKILVKVVQEVCKTRQVCFFALEDKTYTLTPFIVEESFEQDRETLLGRLASFPSFVHFSGQSISPATHPFFTENLPFLFLRDLPEYSEASLDGVILPVRGSGSIIGLLVLGERTDGQSHAETDLLFMTTIIERYVPALSMAQLYTQAHRNKILYAKMFSQRRMVVDSLPELARGAAKFGALLFGAAEVWLRERDGNQNESWSRSHFGMRFEPGLTKEIVEQIPQQDWHLSHFDGQDQATLPPFLQQHHKKNWPAFVWIPLLSGPSQQCLGILLLPNDTGKREAIELFVKDLYEDIARFLSRERLRQEAASAGFELSTLSSQIKEDQAHLHQALLAGQSASQLHLLLKDLQHHYVKDNRI